MASALLSNSVLMGHPKPDSHGLGYQNGQNWGGVDEYGRTGHDVRGARYNQLAREGQQGLNKKEDKN